MLNSSVLDVAIGLIFVYLVLGLMCTTANEWIAQFFDLRAKTMKEGIFRLLHHAPADPASFQPAEINALKLLARLMSPGDRLAVAIGLDPAGSPGNITLDSVELAAIRETLAKRLNDALTDPQLFEKIDVRSVTKATLRRARKQLSGENLQKANAALLREAYPEELGSLAMAFYSHPLIQSLCRAGKLPSYIPAQAFSAALTNILGGGEGVDSVRLAIAGLPESPGRRALTVLASKSGLQLADFEQGLEVWFNQTMDRVSGWYKRSAQMITVVVAAGITVWANADTVGIARNLYVTPAIRQRILQDASAAKSQANATAAQEADVGELTGWSSEFVTFHRLESGNPQSPPDESFPGLDLVTSRSLLGRWLWAIVPSHLLGWILTAVAVSLGAPFWFDTLNKFMNIRAAGTAPDEKGQDKSKS